jgi:hypothetical protein
VYEALVDFGARLLTTVGTSRDTEAKAFIEEGAMSDPMTSLRDRTGILGAALEQWADQASAVDKAAARHAASTVVDAIDALLRDLYLLRGGLIQEIRQADDADRRWVA